LHKLPHDRLHIVMRHERLGRYAYQLEEEGLGQPRRQHVVDRRHVERA
jgi:hypothetical protein